jgi:putative N6-adenine-specific DNA methylase
MSIKRHLRIYIPSNSPNYFVPLNFSLFLGYYNIHVIFEGVPMPKIHLIATSSFGIEAITANELKNLGYEDQFVQDGKVTFAGDLDAICKGNIHLRTAERILLKIGEFEATTFDELFDRTTALPWENWIPRNAKFPVDGKSVRSTLFSVSDCQSIVKKAVAERLKKKYGGNWLEESGETYKIEVALLKDMATLSIDTTGAGLHKRGYRKLVGPAPIKETIAAAMILLSRWKSDRMLIDPFCGTGTIPIEAALIAQNIAPGINRQFTSEGWPYLPPQMWNNVREAAKESQQNKEKLLISGSDIDDKIMSIARYHAKLAGVDDKIHLQCLPVSGISSKSKYGFIICNPPYGERLGEKKEVEGLYKHMGKVFSSFETWSQSIITAHTEFEKFYGKKANKKRKLYNGKIRCDLYQYFGPKPK